MAALSQFLSHLYTMTILFFTILLLELVIFLRSVAGSLCNSKDRPTTAARLLDLIEEKNPASRYRRALWMEQLECTVCLSVLEEGEEIRKLKCNHTFHKACLDTWLQLDRDTCPLCRRKVLPEEAVIRYLQRPDHHDQYEGIDEELIFLLSVLHGNNLYGLL
ncbi:RING-H2 finger protein ATL57-like [Diospyros lotus]|uniref:RING-H2 finger protein ATL57-like n=1 Tax=Diospyros lotus TaxID=55363 RepID=UPI002254F2BD|nr:RING-H2 finger protein ATL57-like [Diospyros lotus]